MAKELPPKSKMSERLIEEAKRRDPTTPGVFQDAVDTLDELETVGRSSSETFLLYGYDIVHVVKPAKADQDRIVRELAIMPSKDISDGLLTVSAVKSKKEIPEFIKEPAEPKGEAPAPVVVE